MRHSGNVLLSRALSRFGVDVGRAEALVKEADGDYAILERGATKHL